MNFFGRRAEGASPNQPRQNASANNNNANNNNNPNANPDEQINFQPVLNFVRNVTSQAGEIARDVAEGFRHQNEVFNAGFNQNNPNNAGNNNNNDRNNNNNNSHNRNQFFQQQQQMFQQAQQAFQQQQQQQHGQQQGPSTGPPPASAAALRQLPTISVSAEDLVEPSNRECCICFEEYVTFTTTIEERSIYNLGGFFLTRSHRFF